MKKYAILFAAAIFLNAGSSQAAKFANQFAEFELPPQWQCNLEGAEWVCQSQDESKKRDAIIVLAAKLKGDQDSLDQYLNYLKQAKVYTSVQGKSVRSDPKYAKSVTLNGHPWVDSLHLESEIPGFYTRYLATVKNDIGVLVTYSINKNKYNQYLSDFENLVNTLKVFRKPGGINAGPASGDLFKNAAIPENVQSGTVFGNPPPVAGGNTGGTGTGSKPAANEEEMPWLLILGGVALVGYFIWRRKQAGG